MGSDGKAAHQAYALTPTLGTADVAPAPAVDVAGVDDDAVAAAAVRDILATAQDIAAGAPATEEDLAAQYALFAAAIHAAQQQAAAEEAAGATLTAVHAEIAAVAGDYLTGLDESQLQALAALHGFDHPALVGLTSATSPLAYWLNPAYPDDAPGKAAIQAKALERFAELAAGGSVAGMTLADLQALEAAASPPAGGPPTGTGAWDATPEQVAAAHVALDQAVAAFTATAEGGGEAATAAFGAMIDAENRLASATCPQAADALALAQAAARHQVDEAIAATFTTAAGSALVGPLVTQAHAEGRLTGAEATLLDPAQQLGLLRASTPAGLRAVVHDIAAHRAVQLAEAQTLHTQIAQHVAAAPDLPPGTSPELNLDATPGALVAFAQTAGRMYAVDADIAGWKDHAHGAGEGLLAAHTAAVAATPDVVALTAQFGTWQKPVPLATLQAAAGELGLQQAEAASRMQARAYLVSHWAGTAAWKDAVQAQIQAQVTPGPAPPAPSSAPPAPAPAAAAVAAPGGTAPGNATPGAPATPGGPATSGGAVPGGAAASTPAPHGFTAKKQALVDALKHHQASHGAIPARHPDSEVAGWTWTPGPHLNLGGAHTKAVYTAPGGGSWMFKPDSSGGARAAAEAEASGVLHAVGIPTVPVHRVTIGGQTGAVQPLLPGATTLSANPASWSQADVDAIVRNHVASWAVGDHDGTAANHLRTAGGGLVPVDRGQAFKFYGQDRLAGDYQPNSAFGDTVSSQAYRAAKKNTLAAGVRIRPEAALATIAAFESIGEGQYRAMLHRTAHEGAAGGVTWAEPMRQRAAARLKVPAAAVSTAAVAEEFLREAVTRKQRLRTDFADFFAAEGIPGGHVLRHG
ncbi:hypothetical protein [Parafrankia sp. FMc2]|uniref:hypothetical protein n=1 Tax=Parafrankia sp. FMc2 TaxID=3233196 RepID=UPI0034D6E976